MLFGNRPADKTAKWRVTTRSFAVLLAYTLFIWWLEVLDLLAWLLHVPQGTVLSRAAALVLCGAVMAAIGRFECPHPKPQNRPEWIKHPVAQPETEHLEPSRYHMIMKVVHKSGYLRQQVIVLRIIALIRGKSLDRKECQNEQASRYKKRAHSRMVPFKSSDCRHDSAA